MDNYRRINIEKIGYTNLVYQRINKKLNINLSNDEIEKMIIEVTKEPEKIEFRKIGKNIYITNIEKDIRLTINSFTNRIITADRLGKPKLN